MNYQTKHIIYPAPATFSIDEKTDSIKVERVCQISKKKYEFIIPKTDFIDWKQKGKPIYVVFDYLTADQREILISGYTPDEWKLLFPEENE